MYYGAGRVCLERVAAPRRPSGGLLVDLTACGLCGSDLMQWYQDPRAPVVLGHEPVGVVAEGRVGAIGPGDRVFVHHHMPCGSCARCRAGRDTLCDRFRAGNIDPGGLAERIAVPPEIAAGDVLALPDRIDDRAATLIEPLACVLRGQRMLGGVAGARVAVVGTGAMGLLQIAAARASGASEVVAVEPRADRRELAREFGAEVCADAQPEAVRQALAGQLADAVFVCTAAPRAISDALHLAAPAGAVQLFAPPRPGGSSDLDLGAIWFREVSIHSTYSAGPADTRAALRALETGTVDGTGLISHVVPLSEVERAFALARSGEALKVMVDLRR